MKQGPLLVAGLLVVLITNAAGQSRQEVLQLEVFVAANQYVDLEHNTALSRARVGELRADLLFTRSNTRTLTFRPVNGATICGLAAESLGETPNDLSTLQFTTKPYQVDIRNGRTFCAAMAMRTRSGKYVRIFASLPRPSEGLYAVALQYLLQPSGKARFGAGVNSLRASFDKGKVTVKWAHKTARRFEVRWFTAGKRTGQRRVDMPTATIDGLRTDRCYQVEVRPFLGEGLGVPRRTSVLTAHTRFVWGRIIGTPDGGYAVNFRSAKPHSSDPDWMPFFWGMRTPHGGGVKYLGTGQALFLRLKTLPTQGYTRFHYRFGRDQVYAIRLRDGRYVKVHVHPGWDPRDKAAFDYVFLAGGGNEIPVVPESLTARFDDKHLSLAWRATPGATRYRICDMRTGTPVVLATTRHTKYTLTKVVPNTRYQLAVIPESRHKAGLGLASIHVTTYPTWWKTGRVLLNWSERNGLEIDGARVLDDKGDFYVSSSAGGMSGLTLTGRALCNTQVPVLVGKHPLALIRALSKLEYGTSIETDNRSPQSERFAVHLKDKGYAVVEIGGESAESGGRYFRFVYIPLTDVKILIALARSDANQLPARQAASLPRLLRDLESNKFARRKRAEKRLNALPIAAIPLLGALLERNKLSLDARRRLERVIVHIFNRR